MNIFKVFFLSKKWHDLLLLGFDIIKIFVLIFISFFVSLLPIQSFFPCQGTPDLPLIIVFCLLFNRYARYFIPIFFLCVVVFEYCFMMPVGSLIIHYLIFVVFCYFTWKKFIDNDISFRLVYFYFCITYLTTLICDVFLYDIVLGGYLSFYDAFLFWISDLMIFPAVFYVTYYFTLHLNLLHRKNNI